MKESHVKMADAAAQSDVRAKNALLKLYNLSKRTYRVKKRARLFTGKLDNLQKQLTGSTKSAEEAMS